MVIFIGFIAAAIAGGLVEYLVGLLVPEKPRTRHLLAIIGSVTIFSFIAVFASGDIVDVATNPSCKISAGEIELTSDIVEVNKTIDASIDSSNPQGRQLIFDWSATRGSMEPSLRTSSNQAVFTAPSTASSAIIVVQISRPGCEPVQRMRNVEVVSSIAGIGSVNPENTAEQLPASTDARNIARDIVIAIDTSGSMFESMADASLAVESFMKYMSVDDQAAIVQFGDSAILVQPLTSNHVEQLGRLDDIGAVFGGGTSIAAGLDAARTELIRNGRDDSEHYVVVLTDGQSEPAETEAIAESMKSEGITIAAVGLGEADMNLLRAIASSDDMTYYADNSTNLLAILLTLR